MVKEGWKQVKFGEVVRLNTERCADPLAEGIERYVGLEHLTPGDLRVREWGLVAEGTTFTNLFRPGQVLFGKRRAYQRKVAVAEFSGVCSGDIYVFESRDPERLLPELLPFICQTERFFEYAVGTSAGSLSPRTNWTQLAEYEFALPPLGEQYSLVKILHQFQENQEALQLAVRKLVTLRDSIIKHRAQELTNIYGLRTIQAVIAAIEAGKSPNTKGVAAQKDEYGVLKVSAVGDWWFQANENKVIEPKDFVSESEVKDGDLLATRANADPASVGRTCYVVNPPPRLMLSDKTWRLHAIPEYQDLRIGILAWTKSPVFRQYIQRTLGGTEAKNISQKAFLNAPFPACPIHVFMNFSHEIESLNTAEVQLKNDTDLIFKIALQFSREHLDK